MPAACPDLCTPETTEFIVLLPEAVVDDEERRQGLIGGLEASFPGSTFRAVQFESLRDSEGQHLVISEPLVVPMMGDANTGIPEPIRRRPSDDRMHDMMATLRALLSDATSLH